MKISIKYCRNCGDKYQYQSSGHGCGSQSVTTDYCEECTSAVRESLKQIPLKRKFIWLKTTDLTTDDIEEYLDKQSKLPNGTIVRVFSTSYNIETGESSNSGILHKNHEQYQFEYWKSNRKIEFQRIRCDHLIKEGIVIKKRKRIPYEKEGRN